MKTPGLLDLARATFDALGGKLDVNGIALASQADAAEGIATTGLMTPDLTRRTILGVPIAATGLATPHILADWLKAPISLERHGCKGDFNRGTGVGTDNATAFARALASGEDLRLAEGGQYLVGGADPISNRTLSIAGPSAGHGAALVFPASAPRGLLVQQDSYRHPTSLRNLALITLGQENGLALEIDYTAADSADARGDVRCVVEGVTASGDNFLNSGWAGGFLFTDVHNLTAPNLTAVGRRDGTSTRRAAFGFMAYGVRVTGSTTASIPSDLLIDNLRVNNAQLMVTADGYVEGLRIERPIGFGVWAGVRANYGNLRPWVRVVGGHINAFDYLVWLTNAPQSRVQDLLGYKIQLTNVADPTGGRTFAALLENCDFSDVSRLRLMNQATDAAQQGAWDGVEIKNSNFCRVADIEHERPSTGMKWSGASTNGESRNYRCLGAYANATIAEYVDATGNGTNRRADGGLDLGGASNASAYTTSTSGGYATSLSLVNVEVGQRIRLDVQMTATNGGTAGEIFYYLAQVGGSATGVFANNAGALKLRGPFAANAEHDGAGSVVVTVTGRGPLSLGLYIITPAGAATVPANGAQIKATLL